VRFLSNLDGSRGESVLNEKSRKLMIEPPPLPLKPRADGSYFGLGWDKTVMIKQGYGYFKDGSFQGMRTFMRRVPNGLNWALLYNASMEFDNNDKLVASMMVQEVREMLEGIEKLPDTDLFNEFS
jgi:hypothetical protein